MAWSDKERAIAKSLLEPNTSAFLKKVFTEIKVANGIELELEKNVAALDNEKYGELMKVVYLSKKENSHRLNLIQQIAQKPKEGKQTPTAPV